MKKCVLWIVLFAFCITIVLGAQPLGSRAATQGQQPSSTASAVLEVSTLRVLCADNADQKMPMASTTKIMTALVAIERGDLSEVIDIPSECTGIEGSSIYLRAHEQLTLEDLLYGLMLCSGNDAATAIATHVGGSVEGFVEMMNEKAAQIGAVNTHFVNPHGLPAEGHYTTAYDLALIAATALKDARFKTIVSTKYKEIPGTPEIGKRTLKNKNKLLWNFEGAIGVKTGYTKQAGKCFVGAAERDGLEVVSVVLNSSNMFEHCAQLMEQAYADFSQVEILTKGQILGSIPVENSHTQAVEVALDQSVSLPLSEEEAQRLRVDVELSPSIRAPIAAGAEIGRVTVYVGDQRMVSQTLCLQQDVAAFTLGDYIHRLLEGW